MDNWPMGLRIDQFANEKGKPMSEIKRTKFFMDTEFIESGRKLPIELLSIGIVCEDGREFYAANADANLTNASPWVMDNVVPYLGKPHQHMGFDSIRRSILEFVGDCKPEFWGYYADYDWVVFCQIFGAMIDLPKGWPMYCRDIKQLCDERGNPKLPKQSSTEHNALNDARWNKSVYELLLAEYVPLSQPAPDEVLELKNRLHVAHNVLRIEFGRKCSLTDAMCDVCVEVENKLQTESAGRVLRSHFTGCEKLINKGALCTCDFSEAGGINEKVDDNA
jgi:hypothetical protein